MEWKLLEMINEVSVAIDVINPDEWRNKFKNWKEATSTSPSGVHLGYHKVLIEPIFVLNDTQMVPDMEIYDKQQEICNLHLSLINKILHHGRSISRWQRCSNTCIPKSIEVDKFRNIHIYECDLSAVLAIKCKSAIIKSEEEDKLCKSQFGSRKSKTSRIPILVELLQQDFSRNTQTNYDQINYDAKACYDRIVPTLALLVSTSFGVHQQVVKLHSHLLKHMTYYVTITGSHNEWEYFNSLNLPIYKTGQGSGNSTHIWTMLSSLLLSNIKF